MAFIWLWISSARGAVFRGQSTVLDATGISAQLECVKPGISAPLKLCTDPHLRGLHDHDGTRKWDVLAQCTARGSGSLTTGPIFVADFYHRHDSSAESSCTEGGSSLWVCWRIFAEENECDKCAPASSKEFQSTLHVSISNDMLDDKLDSIQFPYRPLVKAIKDKAKRVCKRGNEFEFYSPLAATYNLAKQCGGKSGDTHCTLDQLVDIASVWSGNQCACAAFEAGYRMEPLPGGATLPDALPGWSRGLAARADKEFRSRKAFNGEMGEVLQVGWDFAKASQVLWETARPDRRARDWARPSTRQLLAEDANLILGATETVLNKMPDKVLRSKKGSTLQRLAESVELGKSKAGIARSVPTSARRSTKLPTSVRSTNPFHTGPAAKLIPTSVRSTNPFHTGPAAKLIPNSVRSTNPFHTGPAAIAKPAPKKTYNPFDTDDEAKLAPKKTYNPFDTDDEVEPVPKKSNNPFD